MASNGDVSASARMQEKIMNNLMFGHTMVAKELLNLPQKANFEIGPVDNVADQAAGASRASGAVSLTILTQDPHRLRSMSIMLKLLRCQARLLNPTKPSLKP
jgi:3-hydroxyisobutyrate dehydrogenase-like beta-hydroxyacid dehydrogenase